MNEEEILMTIIANAGAAKSCAYEALEAAEEGNYDEAARILKEGRNLLLQAHQGQTHLITADAEGKRPEHLVLTIHAMDLTMSAASEIELIEHFIRMMRKGDHR